MCARRAVVTIVVVALLAMIAAGAAEMPGEPAPGSEAARSRTLFHGIEALGHVGLRSETTTGAIRARHTVDHVDHRGRTQLSYDVTLRHGVVSLDETPGVRDVVCPSLGRLGVVVDAETHPARLWSPETLVAGSAHFSCGRALHVRLVRREGTAGGVVWWAVEAVAPTAFFEHARVSFSHAPARRASSREADATATVELLNFNYDPALEGAEEGEVREGPLVCYNCYAYAEATFSFELEITAFWVTLMEAKVAGHTEVNGDAVVAYPDSLGPGPLEFFFLIGREMVGTKWTFTVAGVPIWITPRLQMAAMTKISGANNASVTVGVTASAEAELGARYQDRAWAPVSDNTWQVELREPQFFFGETDIVLKAYLIPRVTLALWDVVDLIISPKPYLGLQISNQAAGGAAPDLGAITAISDAPDEVPAEVSGDLTLDSSTATSVSLSWSQPPWGDGISRADKYRVAYFKCGAIICTITDNPWIDVEGEFTTPAAVVTGLETDQRYGFRVRAGSDSGWGSWSDTTVVSTANALAAPARPLVSARAADCPAGTAYQLFTGASVSVEIGRVRVPDDVPVIGGWEIFPGGEIGAFTILEPTELDCGALCGGCRDDLVGTAAWVLPAEQRRDPGPSAPVSQSSGDASHTFAIVVAGTVASLALVTALVVIVVAGVRSRRRGKRGGRV